MSLCRLVVTLLCLDVLPLRVATQTTSGLSTSRDENNVRNYSGHALIRTTPTSDSHVTLLTSLQRDDDVTQPDFTVKFLKKPTRPKRHVDILVPPDGVESVSAMFKRAELQYDVIADDVQSLINEQMSEPVRQERATTDTARNSSTSMNNFSLNVYHSYDDIMRWLDRICVANNATCQSVVIGKTYEDRDLRVIKIGADDVSKPAIWIDAGIHAREWIAPATALHIINKLLDSSDRNSRSLLSRFRWYIMPLANPDGYVFTWTTDRMWRKTRSRHGRAKCIGTDLNRNWNFHWAGPGTSNRSCHDDYVGPSPFSEPEARAMSEFLMSLRRPAGDDNVDGGLVGYISLHSYGQHWLTPWGYTQTQPDDYRDMVSMATPAADAIRRTSGRRYTVGQASRLLYVASGGSDDWAKAVAGIKYSYTVELRDTGSLGFILPPSAIEPTGNEMFQSIRTLAIGLFRERRQQQQLQQQQQQLQQQQQQLRRQRKHRT